MGREFGIQLYLGLKIKDPMEIVMLDTTATLKQHKVPLVIYHGNCADGFSAAWVFHHMSPKIEQAFDFHAGVYNDPPPDVKDRIVYLVDFSYKPEVLEKMLLDAVEIWLIDHHKTAIDALANAPDITGNPKFKMYCDLERSGAMLAWDYWNNSFHWRTGEVTDTVTPDNPNYNAPPKLLDHVQDRDLWRFKLAGTREIQAAVFSYEYTFENWDALMLGIDPHIVHEPHHPATDLVKDTIVNQVVMLSELKKAGAAIERKHHKDIAELVKVCQRLATIGDCTVPIASLPYTLTSDAGHLMAQGYRDGLYFAACYWDTTDHRIFSLRSTENGMDVSAVAKVYNGGGHKHAAGFRVPRTHPLAMI